MLTLSLSVCTKGVSGTFLSGWELTTNKNAFQLAICLYAKPAVCVCYCVDLFGVSLILTFFHFHFKFSPFCST